MKNYKLVNSESMIEKAKRLGYENRIIPDKGNDFFLILEKGEYRASNNYHYYYEEITQKDFLALPEPLKVGDWVKMEDVHDRRTIAFKIESRYDTQSGFKIVCGDIHYGESGCTKLTKEQIKILELDS